MPRISIFRLPGASALALIGTLLVVCLQELPAQQGYAIRGDQVVVDRAEHWRAWKGAAGIVAISSVDHSVRPFFMRKDINAALDAPKFSLTNPGGATVGSNPAQAKNLIDGDMSTSWGPDPQSPLKSWWVDVELGRLVVVRKIVVRFAEEGEGDPFLQFKVLGWRRPPPRSAPGYTLEGTDIPNFWEIGRTNKPNKTERVFEFQPRPTEGADGLFKGDPLERIQIIAISSDSTRAQEIAAEEYQALPALQRGTIEYFRIERSGRETRISESEYGAIDPERQGPIRYYRREVPRIAEIEVMAVGDNLNFGLVDRGGSVTIETNGDLKDLGATVADGNYSTGHSGSIFDYRVYNLFADLGALFWVDTMHFLTDGESPVDELFVDVSDGTRAPDGSILWTRVGESTARSPGGHTSPGGVRFREIQTRPSKVRFIRTPFQNPLNLLSYIGFTELMLYGEGFVPEVTLTSDLIQFNGRKNLISIEWEADMPPGTRVQLQTRTGNQLEEEKIYHDSDGNIVTESRYGRLPSSKKGEVTAVFKPGSDWSTWSVPYNESGADIRSPSPRQYMEVRASLFSDRADDGAVLHSITLNTADPVAERLLGEVWPTRIEAVGSAEEMAYYIKPDLTSSTHGFDEIRIEATAGTAMELLSVRTGSRADFGSDQARRYEPADLQFRAAAVDTLNLKLPAKVTRGTELVEVRFRATVFGNSASFRALVQDSASPGQWQRVDEGDPTDLVNSQTVTVLALGGTEIIRDFSMPSRVVTPNGDGVNDEMVFNFGIARLGMERRVRLRIYDLGGSLVGEVVEIRSEPRGNYALRWDGSDASGSRVPPGIYLARVDVDADAESAASTSVERVVYVAY